MRDRCPKWRGRPKNSQIADLAWPDRLAIEHRRRPESYSRVSAVTTMGPKPHRERRRDGYNRTTLVCALTEEGDMAVLKLLSPGRVAAVGVLSFASLWLLAWSR